MSFRAAAKQGGVRIRPAKRRGLDQGGTDESWQILRDAIAQIYSKNASALSFEELYRNAYMLVLHKHGAQLYQNVGVWIRDYLQVSALETILIPLMAVGGGGSCSSSAPAQRHSAAEEEAFLRALRRCWLEHKPALVMIRDILMYADRVYVKSARLPTIYELGLDLFRDYVVDNKEVPVLARMQSSFCHLARMERTGEVIDRGLMKQIVEMLLELGDSPSVDLWPTASTAERRSIVYQLRLEDTFLRETASFYQKESEELLATHDASSYLKRAEARLKQEEERAQHYLLPSTLTKLQRVCEEELLGKHCQTIMEKPGSAGLVYMLEESKLEELERMYRLFKRTTNGLDELKTFIRAHIKHTGNLLNEQAEGQKANGRPGSAESVQEAFAASATGTLSPTAWVFSVSQLKDKYDAILANAFDKSSVFEAMMNEAFQTFINMNHRSPEYLSIFMDEHLKKGSKKSEEELEALLQKAVSLFQFIQEKDIFERHFKNLLAKRLLLGKSLSDDLERFALGKIKTECGFQFTSKMEGMFKDMSLSADTQTAFKDYITNTETKLPFELTVNVLTSTFWPITINGALPSMPDKMRQVMETFSLFYSNRHTGRKLTWQMGMGNVDLKAEIRGKKYEFSLSTYQAIILLLLNRKEQWSVKEIEEETGIPRVDLLRSVQSLACGKIRVLAKEPKSRDVAENHRVSVNDAFTAPQFRIKIPLIASASVAKVEQDEESRQTRVKVEEDRKHITDAAIVRVMKSRKTMDHNNLVMETTKQLQSRFQPDPMLIKKRIEVLIEREYLERSAEDRKMYKYLA